MSDEYKQICRHHHVVPQRYDLNEKPAARQPSRHHVIIVLECTYSGREIPDDLGKGDCTIIDLRIKFGEALQWIAAVSKPSGWVKLRFTQDEPGKLCATTLRPATGSAPKLYVLVMRSALSRIQSS